MIIQIKLASLQAVCSNRPKGYAKDVVSTGTVTGEWVKIEESDYVSLRNKHGIPVKQTPSQVQKALAAGQVVTAVPYPEWPLWAKALKFLATPEDKGIGDVIRRTIGAENSDKFKAWYKKTTGKDCGCTGRQARWNIMYSLGHE